MSNVQRMDQQSTRNESKNQQLLATLTSITLLSSQTVQHWHQTGRLMRILKPPWSYIVSNFVKVRDLTANTDTEPHTYNPLCYDSKRPFLAKSNIKQLKTNWRPDQGMVNQQVWAPRAPPTQQHPHPPLAATTDNKYMTISSL